MNRRPFLYICGPFATATQAEIDARDSALRSAVAKGYAPLFLPYCTDRFLNDKNTLEREIGLEMCRSMVAHADVFCLVGGRITEGMRIEIDEYLQRGEIIPIDKLPQASTWAKDFNRGTQ